MWCSLAVNSLREKNIATPERLPMQNIIELWKRQPGKYFFICTKSGAGKWSDHAFARKDLNKVRAFIKDNADKDVYFCPHGFSEPRRKKEYAELPKVLWADLDEADPKKMEKNVKPTIAIQSSPGRYVGLWFVDHTMKESLNKRLSYHLGADQGGWDLTQVLRVPGTVNYKYNATPRVKLLWNDGPVHKVSALEKLLPELEDEISDDDEEDGITPADIYARYAKVIPPMTRQELMRGKPTPGKRSEVLWKLTNDLVEAGLTREETYILIKASPWNKFRGRQTEDTQLNRELDKIFGKKLNGKKGWSAPDVKEGKKNEHTFLTQSMDEVEEENIDWIWYPYLARGEVTIVEGDPGVGKSYLMQMISKGIVDGDKLPTEKKTMPRLTPGPVAYFDIENSAGSVTKKRLRYNGCENMRLFYQEQEPFSVDNTEILEKVYDGIERLKPVMCVFDTVNLYIGKADTSRGSETTQALANFKDIARRFNCAVVILRHLTKGGGQGTSALYRGQGNIAFTGVSRIVMTVGRHNEDPDTKVVAMTKCNLAPFPRAITYTITGMPDTLKERDRSKFEWTGFCDLTSDDIIKTPEDDNDRGKEGNKAKAFLEEVLAEGAVEVAKIQGMAETRSISWRTLQRAANDLDVKRKTQGFGKGKVTAWSLAVMSEKHKRAKDA